MDGGVRGRGRWRNLKQRLRLKGIGFCGSPWSVGVGAFNIEDALEEEPVRDGGVGQIPDVTISAPPCVVQIPATSMNLATALAAERNLRPVGPTIDATTGGTPTFTPLRSLMGLFEETDGEDRQRKKRDKEGGGGIDEVCCVCMERNKGAAFIPCGHTYCRVCSREVWLNRGSCPLCNRSITEILDIF